MSQETCSDLHAGERHGRFPPPTSRAAAASATRSHRASRPRREAPSPGRQSVCERAGGAGHTTLSGPYTQTAEAALRLHPLRPGQRPTNDPPLSTSAGYLVVVVLPQVRHPENLRSLEHVWSRGAMHTTRHSGRREAERRGVGFACWTETTRGTVPPKALGSLETLHNNTHVPDYRLQGMLWRREKRQV